MMSFTLPQRIQNSAGQTRRVGFELEFGGLDMDETAEILIGLFGGTVEKDSRYEYRVVGSKLGGEIGLEADANFLKEKRYEKYCQKLGIELDSPIGSGIEEGIAKLAGTLVPLEIVLPPLPIDALDPVERIREELHQHSAKGTRSGLFTAFGMQFNPEVPDFEGPTLARYMKAFFLVFDWLYEESDIDLARKLSPYIHNFPKEYIELVLKEGYAPDTRGFMIDYLTHNPTRNRPVDLLPLFAHIDRELVFSYPVEKDLVKARPTFHYRLPNCEVDDPRWTIATEWNRWVAVENLAADPERLEAMARDYHGTVDGKILPTKRAWIEKAREWVHGAVAST